MGEKFKLVGAALALVAGVIGIGGAVVHAITGAPPPACSATVEKPFLVTIPKTRDLPNGENIRCQLSTPESHFFAKDEADYLVWNPKAQRLEVQNIRYHVYKGNIHSAEVKSSKPADPAEVLQGGVRVESGSNRILFPDGRVMDGETGAWLQS